VRVTCPANMAPESVSRVFHVGLPPDARAAELRKALEPGLPKDGQVLATKPNGARVPLKDGDLVPDQVALSRYEGVVTMRMIVTRDQGRLAQEMLKHAMLRPDIQEKLNELERKAAGNDTKYRMLLRNLLNWEIYPPIVRYFGLPDDGKGPFVLWQGIGAHLGADLELNEAWLELEIIMRNKLVAGQAYEAVRRLRQAYGLPELQLW